MTAGHSGDDAGDIPGLRRDGMPVEQVEAELRDFLQRDRAAMQGIGFSRRFFPNQDVSELAAFACGLFAQSGRASPYPGLPSPVSMSRMQADILDAARALLHGDADSRGIITSGGTESVIMAVRTCLQRAREEQGLSGTAEIVAPWSAHPCIDKAAELLGLRLVRVPVGADLRADLEAMARAITSQTVMLYGSFPSYCYGLEDDIAALGALADERGLWLHVDACMSGFLAPFLRRNGEPVPAFDFSLPGVSSISADLHKHGYSAKGASVLLFRSQALARCHSFTYSDYPLPPMTTPTLAGTASGAPIASAWAVMRHLGIDGYSALAAELIATRKAFIAGIEATPEFHVLGDPLFSLLAVGSQHCDMRKAQQALAERNWFTLPLTWPPAVHINLSAADKALAEPFAADLAEIGAILNGA